MSNNAPIIIPLKLISGSEIIPFKTSNKFIEAITIIDIQTMPFPNRNKFTLI